MKQLKDILKKANKDAAPTAMRITKKGVEKHYTFKDTAHYMFTLDIDGSDVYILVDKDCADKLLKKKPIIDSTEEID